MAKSLRKSASELENKAMPGLNAHKLWYFLPTLLLGVGAIALNISGIAPNLVGWGEFAQGTLFNSAEPVLSALRLGGLACEVASIPTVGAIAYNGIRRAITYKKYKNASEAIVSNETAKDMTSYELELTDTQNLINSVFVDLTKDSALIRYLDLADKKGKKHLSFAKKEALVHEEDYIKLVISKLCDRLAELTRLKHRNWRTTYSDLTERDINACKEEMLSIQQFLRQVINKREGVEPFAKTIMSKMKKYRKDLFDGATQVGIEIIPEDDGNAEKFYRLLTQNKIKDAFLEAFKFSAPHLSDEDVVATPEQEDDLGAERFRKHLDEKTTEVDEHADKVMKDMDKKKTEVDKHADEVMKDMDGEKTRVHNHAEKTIKDMDGEKSGVASSAETARKEIDKNVDEVRKTAEQAKTDIKGLLSEVSEAKATFDKELEKANDVLGKISKEHIRLKIDIVNKWYSNVLKQISAYSEEDIQEFIAFLKDFRIFRDTVVDVASRVGAITAVLNNTNQRAHLTEKSVKMLLEIIKEFDKSIDRLNTDVSSINSSMEKGSVSQLSGSVKSFQERLEEITRKLNVEIEHNHDQWKEIFNLSAKLEEQGNKKAITPNPDLQELKKIKTNIKKYARIIAYYLEARPNEKITVSTNTLGVATKYIHEEKIKGPVKKTTNNISYSPEEAVGAWFNDFLNESNIDIDKITLIEEASELLGKVKSKIEEYNRNITRKKNAEEFSDIATPY